MARLIDLTGQRFGKLTVLYREGHNTVGRFTWKCKCDCGNYTWSTSLQMKQGKKGSCGCSKTLPMGQESFNRVFYSYKKSARDRDLGFDLSKEYFRSLIFGDCFYCGKRPSNIRKNPNSTGNLVYNGIDRVDNDKGYIEGNCVSCCTYCNRAKSNRSKDEFLAWVTHVYNYAVLMKSRGLVEERKRNG